MVKLPPASQIFSIVLLMLFKISYLLIFLLLFFLLLFFCVLGSAAMGCSLHSGN